MKIAIATVQVPFTTGGAEILVNSLNRELLNRKYEVDIINIPFKWYPSETLINSMIMGRMIDLSEVNGVKIDLVIAMKFPAYYLKHDNKIIWLIHQHRQAYDLWGTAYGDIQTWPDGEFIRNMVFKNDNLYIPEAKKIFTISQNNCNRLKKYNNIDSKALYNPPINHEKLHCKGFEDFIFYPSRINEIKRQRLLVEAAIHIKSSARIYIAGGGCEVEINHLKNLIEKYNLQSKVKLLGYISEEEKIDYYSRCLAVYFGVYDEDYGYIALEACFSKKPCIVHTDSGGPLEFIRNNYNGYVTEPRPELVAEKIDELMINKSRARDMGETGYQTMLDKNVSWEYVIKSLLG